MFKDWRIASGSSDEQIRILFTFIGLATGILGYCYYEYVHSLDVMKGAWMIHTVPPFFLATFANFFFMTYDREHAKPSTAISFGLSTVLSLLLYLKIVLLTKTLGAERYDRPEETLIPLFSLFWIITQIALPLAISAMMQGPRHPSYELLHRKAWNLPFMSGSACLLVGCMWLALLLWALMFKMFRVDLFLDLFGKEWFYIPFSAAVYGLGIAIAREKEQTIAQARDLVINLARTILPVIGLLLTFMTPMFLLVVLGIALTDADGRLIAGVWACLALLTAGIFKVNTAIGYNEETATHSRVLRLAAKATVIGMAGLILLPWSYFLSVVGQYGLTPPRLLGLVVVTLLSVYAITYAKLLARHRFNTEGWMESMRRNNIWIAYVVLAVALWLASPFGNVNAIAAAQQVDRLRSGKVSASAFDYEALQYKFGIEGKQALKALKEDTSLPDHKAIKDNIELTISTLPYESGKNRYLPIKTTVWPKGETVPADLLKAQDYTFSECRGEKSACVVVKADLIDNNAGGPEYILLKPNNRGMRMATIFYRTIPDYGDRKPMWSQRGASFKGTTETLGKARDFTVESRSYKVLVIDGQIIDPLSPGW